jgi:hypothetical protein
VTSCEPVNTCHVLTSLSSLLNHPSSATGWYCFSHFVVVLNHQYVNEKVFGIKFQVFQNKTNVKIKYHQNILLASLIIHHHHSLSFPSSPSSQTQTQSSKNPIQKKEIKNQAATPQAPPTPPFPNQKTTENRKRQQLLKLNGKNSNKHTT